MKKKQIEISPFLGVPLLIGLAAVSIPYGLIAIACLAVRERRLFRRLKSCGRTLDWREVEQHLAAGRGTLIIEQAQKESLRLWWTADDVVSQSPFPIPPFDALDFMGTDPKLPFVVWCHRRYLARDTGSASLSRPKGLALPSGFVTPDFFATRFPAARVVATTLTP